MYENLHIIMLFSQHTLLLWTTSNHVIVRNDVTTSIFDYVIEHVMMPYALRVQPPHATYDVTVIEISVALVKRLVAGKHQRT